MPVSTRQTTPKNRGRNRFFAATRRVNIIVAMPDAETDQFEAATASYRRELLAHCYRMTGSVHEITRISLFADPVLFPRFDLPTSLRVDAPPAA
jgi:hypothetical protein